MTTLFSFPYIQTPGGPGAYCDALPTGEFVAYLPGERIETHLGPIDFYDSQNEPLFPRISPVGPLKFCGQGHLSDRAIEWDGQWTLRPETVYGVSGLIYDNTGTLHLATPATGSQGYRYVTADNVIVTGDATYGPIPGVPLCEWTQLLPDLYVGQGTGDGGLYVVDGGTVRVLVPESAGFCRFIRARIKGEAVSLAWWGQGTRTSEGRLTTVSELRALPPLAYGPVPPPQPPPTPAPPTPETPMTTPNHFDTVQRVYANGTFDLTTHDGSGQFTEACAIALHARDPRWGHLKKTGAQNKYNGHAVDAVLYLHDTPGQSQAVDIIVGNAAPGAKIGWGLDIPRYSKTDWLKPEGSVPVPTPTPTPVPPTPQPPAPTPEPPPNHGDPILDAPLTPAYPVGYAFWVANFERIMDEAEAWYYRAFKHSPAASDVAHGLWRALNEGERWKTLRGAFEDTWPGGGR